VDRSRERHHPGVNATNKPLMNDWVTITVENGKVAAIREYIDTQALARVSDD